MRTKISLSLGLIALVAAACSSGGASSSPAVSAAASVAAAPSVAAVTAAPSIAPSATPDACAPAKLALATAGKLTIGTDNPAYPPYFKETTGGAPAPWQLGDPNNGTGFESAVGYAIADRMGFAKGDVTWVVVPFLNSFAPGPKTFDFDLTQVNYKPERTKTADLSKGYYFGNQALVALKDSPLAKATSIAALKDYVYGAQTGTTSYDAIAKLIAPSKDARQYDSNDLAVKALGNKSIDGIVVDLPTADFITNVTLPNAVIVGQFDGGTPEYFSAVLAKDSPLTECVNRAIDSLTADGTLKALASKELPFQDTVPFIKP